MLQKDTKKVVGTTQVAEFSLAFTLIVVNFSSLKTFKLDSTGITF